MKIPFAALALAAALVPHGDAAAKCARVEQVPLVMSKSDTKVAPDGGIVIGWENSTSFDDESHGDPSVQSKWVAYGDGKKIDYTATTLAPGLTVYRPTKALRGRFELRDAKGVSKIRIEIAPSKHDVLAAPKVTHVVRAEHEGYRGGTDASVTVSLDSVPDDAVALVISTANSKPHAMSFGRPSHDKAGATTVLVYESPGHCGGSPPSTESAAAGAKVTLAWVDSAGRLSAATSAITVEAGKP